MARRAHKYPEKSAVMNFRITPQTKRLLAKAATESGRTVSSECEHQLQRALSDIGTGPTYALMMTIGKAIDSLIILGSADGAGRWWSDPYLFDQAAGVVTAAFEMFRPKGELLRRDDVGSRQGEFLIKSTLRELQLVDESVPFDKQSPHQRWLTRLKQELGTIVNIPVIWDMTAEQAKELHERSREVLRELIPLSRKAAATPQAMTEEETQNLKELWAKVAEIRLAVGAMS
jgi:hypothetical protein